MPKLRKTARKGFTTIDNTILRDKRVGSSARGVYCTMVSMADGWNFTVRGLAAIMGEGVAKISTALKKLEETKYLIRRRVYENGKIVDWEYLIFDEPYEDESDEKTSSASSVKENVENSGLSHLQDTSYQDTKNLDTGNQDQGHSDIENPDVYKNITKEEITKEELSIDQSINQSNAEERKISEPIAENSDDGLMDGYVSEQQIYTEVVKNNIDFWDFTEYIDEDEAEEIVQMIVRQICSRKPTERICGQDFPREVVKSAMLKVDIYCLENAIEQMKQAEDIRNYERYFISTLYNEVNNYHFKENAEKRCAEYQVKRDFVEIY